MRTFVLCVMLAAAADGTFAANGRGTAAQPAAPAVPVLSAEVGWVPRVLAGIGAVILAAALLGPLLRMGMPEEIPQTHSHDEPPGSSHHHGPGGTIDLVLPDHGE
jgi:hypothetical protein